MTEAQFDNGYWYATDLKDFAIELGIPSASKLRKDEIEAAIRHYLRTREIKSLVKRSLKAPGIKDIDKGLRLDRPIVNYTSNRATKDFIARAAAKIDPGFRQKSGTRYLLNRWREDQLSKGKAITYGDLVRQAITLSASKTGPLRVEHGRYINFISDFMAHNRGATRDQAVRAWKEVKAMDAPKTYASWAKVKKR